VSKEFEIQRKLAAVFAADVEGFSRLMSADENGTLRELADQRRILDEAIARHRGRIANTAGDSVLAEFPSVSDAVQCAVEAQQALEKNAVSLPEDRRVLFRIGIHLGDVTVSGCDLLGNGVNIASRLQSIADANGVVISSAAYEQVRKTLSLSFTDLGERRLKGLGDAVHAFALGEAKHEAKAESLERLILAGPGVALPLPDKPSIAVLPFQNMSGDAEQEYFADGVVEDIITALSRYPSLFVIARNSSFTYKGRAVDVKQVGRELGVRYVLEGSLRKVANRVRITAQLIEAETGNHVWAQRYDRELADIFAVQDEITEAATIAIAPAIADAELQRVMRKPPGSLDAWGAYQRGLWHLAKFSRDDTVLAETFFQQAMALDPAFAGGFHGLAAAQIQAASTFMTRTMPEALDSAEALARQAVGLDRANAEALTCLGRVLLLRGEYEGGRAEVERALAISPNLASAHGILGGTMIFSGSPKEGLVALERGIRLDPRDPRSGISVNQVVLAHYYAREYETAIQAAKRVIRSYPDHPLVYRWLAAALGQTGRIDEARAALAKAIAIAPASFDLYVRHRAPWHRPEDYAHMLDGLCKAGWSQD